MAHIMIIDDDILALESLQIVLEDEGHEVVAFQDGNKALQQIEQQAFDLVITDLIMPEIEGIEIIMNIRRHHPHLKVIAISGGGRNEPGTYLKTASQLGAVGTLTKPFAASELIKLVGQTLAA